LRVRPGRRLTGGGHPRRRRSSGGEPVAAARTSGRGVAGMVVEVRRTDTELVEVKARADRTGGGRAMSSEVLSAREPFDAMKQLGETRGEEQRRCAGMELMVAGGLGQRLVQ
jgi:hypothetical protein